LIYMLELATPEDRAILLDKSTAQVKGWIAAKAAELESAVMEHLINRFSALPLGWESSIQPSARPTAGKNAKATLEAVFKRSEQMSSAERKLQSPDNQLQIRDASTAATNVFSTTRAGSNISSFFKPIAKPPA